MSRRGAGIMTANVAMLMVLVMADTAYADMLWAGAPLKCTIVLTTVTSKGMHMYNRSDKPRLQ